MLTARSRSLIVAGAVLFLLGLMQGVFIQNFLNPRMALSAHLTAVQSGMAIMLVGVVWSNAGLKSWVEITSRWAMAGGMYMLWVGLTLSAVTGASNALPIARAGHEAAANIEQIVSTIGVASSGTMIIGWMLFVVGLLRSGHDE